MAKRKRRPRGSYRFAILTKRGKRVNVRSKTPHLVRSAAYQFARTRGWRVSSRATPQGVSVIRVG